MPKKLDKFMTQTGLGLMRENGKTYKAVNYRGPKIKMQEIDVAEYDARIHKLAQTIASSPQVDLLDVLKDALYDLSLNRLSEVERMLEKELAEAKEPQIKTTKRDRGTCINLAIGNRFACILRE